MDIQFFQQHFLKRLSFQLLLFLCQKSTDLICTCKPISDYSDALIYLCTLNQHYFDYCGFIMSPEVRQCKPYNLSLFKLGSILPPLQFQINFRISVSIFTKSLLGFCQELHWIYRSIWEESLWPNLPIYEYGVFFPFIKVFNFSQPCFLVSSIQILHIFFQIYPKHLIFFDAVVNGIFPSFQLPLSCWLSRNNGTYFLHIDLVPCNFAKFTY